MNIQTALENVSRASEDYRNAQQRVLSARRDLLALSPIKKGDKADHGRYGKCTVFCIDVRPHPEYGALWEITACPHLKDGRPGMRKITWLEKIIF
jgi:hypothetical protein